MTSATVLIHREIVGRVREDSAGHLRTEPSPHSSSFCLLENARPKVLRGMG